MPEYKETESGIYQIDDLFVTSLSFEQEPEYGEGENSSDISQYPLEDILDRYYVYVSDFYEAENQKGGSVCVLEFASSDADDVRNLRSIIGMHVYNNSVNNGSQEYCELVIEPEKEPE